MTTDDIFPFLKKRKGLLDGVVLSGGEATLYQDLPDFCERIREMGFAIKLDTNGSLPHRLQVLLERNLLDYVALDYKAPRAAFSRITQSKISFSRFEESLRMLCAQTDIPFEVRTTVHSELLSEEDIHSMQKHLLSCGYRGVHYIQNFLHGKPTLGALQRQTQVLELSKTPCLPTELRNFTA